MHELSAGPQNSTLLFLIPLLPLIGASINLLFGKRIQDKFGKTPIHGLAILMPGLSGLLAWFVLLPKVIAHHEGLHQHLWDWIVIGLFDAHLALTADTLSMVMVLIVTTVGTLIHVYSVGYMAEERSYWRFFGYLNIFMFFMLTLVMGDNFLVMFVGWEGVGFASYALIGFWYRNTDNAVAGMKAFIVNRVGDFAFIIGMGLLFWGFQGSYQAPMAGGQKGFVLSAQAATQTRSFVPGTPEFIAAHEAASAQNEADASAHQHAGEHAAQAAAEHAKAEPVAASLTFRILAKQLAEEVPGSMPDKVCEHGHCEEAQRAKTRGDLLAAKKLWGMPLLFVVCVLFFIGATGKSAQIPLFVWLPDAMAGPTSVSALIHAATMVTAGVYMIARLNFLYALTPGAMTVVATVGALTALFAATIGFFQYDIKKVLAYSTVSQLGYMFIGVGVGAYWAGIFHLLTHAMFKACLFLSSGSVIMGSHHNQDMRWMGGLKKYMPRTAWAYWAATVAISGFPIGAAYYSKDEILWKAFDSGNMLLPGGGLMIWILGFVAAMGTSFYMWRSYYATFTGVNRHDKMPAEVAHEQHAKILRDEGMFFDPESGALSVNADGSDAEHGHDAHGDDDEHGHSEPFVPHESPLSVTGVLITLGVAALGLGIVLGFPELWAHSFHIHIPNLFEHWIHHTVHNSDKLIDGAGHGMLIEWTLALGSISVASIGWLGARALYRNRGIPFADEKIADFDVKSTLQALAQPRQAIPSESGLGKFFDVLETIVVVPIRLLARIVLGIGSLFGDGFNKFVRASWSLVYDKYRIDELYHWAVVKRVIGLTCLLWDFDKWVIDGAVLTVGFLGRAAAFISGGFDRVFIDGAVEGVASLSMGLGNKVRHMQNGQIQSYLMGIVGGGIVLVLVNYLIFGL